MRKLLGISGSAKPVRCPTWPSASPDSGHVDADRRDPEHGYRLGAVERANYRLLVLALAFIICLSGLSGSAMTYYVAPTGLDLNPGTALQPWKTIQKGANTAAAGNIVL